MIKLTRLGPGKKEIMVNPDLIEVIEMTPDTVVSLASGNKFLVQEPADEVRRRVIQFRAEILAARKTVPCRGVAETAEEGKR